jgi:NADPH2:quinone reductase
MRAAVVRRACAVHEVMVEPFDDPLPGAGDVIVELGMSDVNYADILFVEGRYQRAPALPFVPGLAGAGRIVAVGDGVSERTVGERVVVLPENGTFGERVRAPGTWCFPMPDAMPFEVAAAFGLAYQTAWFALMERGGFRPGDAVLILGAKGGVAMAAIQLARALGAGTIFAATRGEDGAAFARQVGADIVIDTAGEGIRDAIVHDVRTATAGRGADILIDPVGGEVAAAAVRALAWGGRHVVVGFASGDIPTFAANYLLVKNITVSGLQWTDYRSRKIDQVRDAQARIFALWTQGRLKPVIQDIVPLDQFGTALTVLAAAKAQGKLILAIGKAIEP